uniref:Protein LLP homolog n=1 Tax=Rhodnius prolixus TaxID=13249 RepID=R4FLU5_RHOPR
MAKSLRSKWKRKMKALKRERYGKKELEKLKQVLDGAKREGSKEIDMTDLQELVNVVPPPGRSHNDTDHDVTEEQMEVGKKARIFDPATMRDQFGNYPVWMGSHRKKKVVKTQRKLNKIKKKKR